MWPQVSRPGDADALYAAERLVGDALPPGWSLRSDGEPLRGRQADASWTVSSPDGAEAVFSVLVRQAILGREVDQLLAPLADTGSRPVVAAPFLGETMRGVLAGRGASFADATGNLRLVSDRPGLFVERQGETRNPWPQDTALRSLRGRGAGRAVRALVDFAPPFGVRELARRSGVPLGSLSRTLDLLERDGLVTRGERGMVTGLDCAAAIRRWTQDYAFAQSNRVTYYLEPRGLDSLAARLEATGLQYAATGAFAAQRWYQPVAPARQATLYVAAPSRAAEALKLRPAETGANVVLAEPFDPVVFDRTVTRDGLRLVAAAQLAADLLTGPGREPQEGVELLTWMERNENAWRA